MQYEGILKSNASKFLFENNYSYLSKKVVTFFNFIVDIHIIISPRSLPGDQHISPNGRPVSWYCDCRIFHFDDRITASLLYALHHQNQGTVLPSVLQVLGTDENLMAPDWNCMEDDQRQWNQIPSCTKFPESQFCDYSLHTFHPLSHKLRVHKVHYKHEQTNVAQY